MALLFAQLTHSLGLNDVCDALGLHSGPLSAIRGATAPKRNTLSHANRKRNWVMAEKLFWQTLEHSVRGWPVSTSHARAVWWDEVVTIRFPSRLNQAASMPERSAKTSACEAWSLQMRLRLAFLLRSLALLRSFALKPGPGEIEFVLVGFVPLASGPKAGNPETSVQLAGVSASTRIGFVLSVARKRTRTTKQCSKPVL